MNERCENPVSLEMLTDYWAAALSSEEEDLVEEHLLGCDACGGRLREIIATGKAIRQVAREGRVRVIVSKAYLERAASEGLRIREYAPPNGGSVECTVTPDDDLLIGRLAADLSAAKRLDVRYTDRGGTRRLADVPFNPKAPDLYLSTNVPLMLTMPAHTATVELISVGDDGEMVIGEYTFNHTPSV